MYPKRISTDNWTKNHKTGVVTQLDKIKPATRMKSKAHIQIFDAAGAIEQEAVAENVMARGLNQYYTQELMKELVKSQSGKFGRLIVNNYAGAEDTDRRYMPDYDTYPTIAWANKYTNYSGADLFKGDWNESESTAIMAGSELDIVFVYDWATDKGNGTFNSLWWTYDSGTGTDLSENYVAGWEQTTPQVLNHVEGTNDGHCFLDGLIYSVDTAGNIYEHNPDIARMKLKAAPLAFTINPTPVKNTTADFVAEGAATDDLAAILTDGTFFYVFNSTDNLFIKYNTSWVVQSSFAYNETTYGRPRFIYNGKLYSHSTYNIYEHDLTGAAPTTYDMLTLNGNGATMLHVLCDGNNVLANYGNYTYILDASFLYESRLSHVTATEGMDGYNEQFDLMLQSDSPDIEGIPWGTFWTPTVHNLLAAPVTKTVANTMKITYTFTLEILDMVPLIPV